MKYPMCTCIQREEFALEIVMRWSKIPFQKLFNDFLPLFGRHTKTRLVGAAPIAQWIRPRVPSCRPGFESQAHHLCFFQFKLFKLYICHLNWNVKRTKINKKRPGLAHFFKTRLAFTDFKCSLEPMLKTNNCVSTSHRNKEL